MHRNAKVSDETENRLLKAAQAPCDQTARESIEDATRKYKRAVSDAVLGSIQRATNVPMLDILSSQLLSAKVKGKVKEVIRNASRGL